MSSTDKRIVVLEFDNSNFEKNVAQSNETLQKLKENLKLEGASHGLKLISDSAKTFSLSKVGEAIGTVTTKFSALGVIGKRVLENLTDSAMGLARNLLTAIPNQIASGGWSRALKLEQANFQMRGLLGETEEGAKKIEAIMNSVKESVSGTAYGLDDAAKVASQLVATGIEDSGLMLKYLKGVAGAAAMTGGSYEDIGRIFTTVAGQGRLMGDQLLQFATRGVNVAATLSKQMGITEAEFRDLVTKGEISFDQFASGMAEAFGEHATKANETFTGSLSNMRAALSRIGADVATPALTNLRDIFNALRPIIDNVHVALQPLIDALNTGLTSATEKAVSFLNGLNEKLGKFVGTFKKDSETAKESAEVVTEAMSDIDEMAQKVIRGDYGNGEERRQALEALGYSYERVQNKVNELLGCSFRYEVQEENLTDATLKQKDAAEKLKEEQHELNEAYKSNALDNFLSIIRNVVKAFGQVGGVVRSAFQDVFAGPIFKGVSGLSDKLRELSEGLIMNKEQADGLKNIFKLLFSIIKAGLSVVSFVADRFFTMMGTMSNLRKKLLEFIGGFKDTNAALEETNKRTEFLSSLQGVVSKLADVFERFKNKVKEVAERVRNTEGFRRLQIMLSELRDTLKELAEKVFDKIIEKFKAFSNFNPDFSWLDKLGTLIGKVAGHIADFIKETLAGEGPLHDFFSWLSGTATKGFQAFMDLVTGKGVATAIGQGGIFSLGDVFTRLREGIAGFFRDFSFGNISDSLATLFVGANGDSISGAKSIITTIIDRLIPMLETLRDRLSDIGFDDILANVQKVARVILGLVGILRILKLLKSVDALVQSATGTIESVKGMFGSISGAFGQIGGYFSDLRKNLKRDSVAKIITSISILVGALAASLFVLSKIPAEDLTRSVEALFVVLTTIGGMFALIGSMSFISGNKMQQFGKAVQGFGIGIALLVPSIIILGKTNWPTVLRGVVYVGMVMTELAVAAKIAGSVKGAAAFLGLAGAVAILVPAILILGIIPVEKVRQGVVTIGIVMGELAIAAAAANKFGGPKGAAAFLGLAAAVDLLVPALLILGVTPWSVIRQGAIALGVVLGEIVLAIKFAQGADAKTLLALTVPLGVAIVGLAVLSAVPMTNLLVAAIALGGVMLAIGAAGKLAAASHEGALMMVALSIPLLAACYSLAALAEYPWENLLAAAGALGGVFLAISGAIAILSLVQFPAGLAAIGLMALFFGALAAVIATMGYLFGEGGQFEGLMDRAIPVMEAFGEAIGTFIGSIFETIGESVSATLERFGEAIGNFGDSIVPFIDSVKMVDESVLSGCLRLCEAVLAITATEFISNLTSFFGLGPSALEKFGKELVAFAPLMAQYADQINGIGPATVTASASAASILADMYKTVTDAGVTGGVIGTFLTGEPLKKFGEELVAFGPNLKEYASSISGVSPAAVTASASAASILADMYKTISDAGISDGVIDNFLSGKPLEKFGEELAAFGPNIKQYATDVSGISEGAATASAVAASMLAEMYGTMVAAGVKDEFFDKEPLVRFGEELVKFGPNIKTYADSVSGINAGAALASSIAGQMLVNLYSAVVAAGITDSWGEGEPLTKFSGQAVAFGQKMAEFVPYAETVSGGKEAIEASIAVANSIVDLVTSLAADIDYTNLTALSSAFTDFASDLSAYATSITDINYTNIYQSISASQALKDMIDSVSNAKTKKIESYGDAIAEYGSDLRSYDNAINGITYANVYEAIQVTYKLIEVGNTMANVNTTAMGKFGEALTNIGKTGVDGFVSAFTTSYERALSAGDRLGQAAISGVRYGSSYYSWWNIGTYCIQGFINGLASGYAAIYSTAYSVANAAISAVQNAFGIASPSKEMYALGDYAIQGFVNAFSDGTRTVYAAGDDMANTALRAMTKPVEMIQRMFDTDLDLTPTITPVLDLSSIANGAGVANGMLSGIGGSSYLGTLNIGGIGSSSFEDTSQTSQMDRLIDVISGLLNEDRVTNNTFNITGDNPREIAEEVSRIIQSQVERREATWA